MKRLSFLLLFLSFLTSVAAGEVAATIELRVKNESPGALSYTLPVNHIVFWGAVQEDTLTSGTYNITLRETQTGFVHIRVMERVIRLFVQPGDHLRVSI